MSEQIMRFSDVETLLREMNEQGQFIMSVLTDGDGLPIAAATRTGDRVHDHSAVAAFLVQRTARQVQSQLDMGQPDEVSIADQGQRRLVCRPFQVQGQSLILAVMVPDRRSYRRLTNQTIRTIQRGWKL
jgi:predicted regulator of Ras-like GTPase activity (Roadblock/LC7/MglB family)